ncbi:putative glycoside hydrolase [Candidatus Parcubacteria bacterium]|nr:putative glycoside hydrolase [Candidatus Parcubacteria bacterium]
MASGAAVFVLAGLFVLPQFAATTYVKGDAADEEKKELQEEIENIRKKEGRLETPQPLKGIYMSQCVVGSPAFRDSLVKFIDDTDLNAVVIDVKDFSGTIGFQTEDPRFSGASMQSCGARDLKAFLKTLHDKGIYTIARITVFQDPEYSSAHPDEAVQSASTGRPWEDHKGLNFVDVSSEPFWDYIVTLSKETYALGFDELNFDYIRYPSDGPMKDAVYKNPNKAEALEKFFAYLHAELKPTGAILSADLFGMTASNTDDLGIGQVLERALPYFDYIMPMVYPSHYPDGFNGFSDPNLYPYEIVHFAMERAAARTVATQSSVRTLHSTSIMRTETVPATATTGTTTREVATGLYSKEKYDANKIRPWLQDFDYGKNYLPADILAQIQATNDAGLTSWIFWDPANKYDSVRAVMAK